MISSNLSPDELTLSELRTSGLTPQQKSTGFLARSEVQEGSQYKGSQPREGRPPTETPAWKGRTLRVLSVFSGQELSPRVEEGAGPLAGDMSVKVKTVDVSSWLLDKHRAWTPAAKELLHSIQQQSYDLVFVTFPAKGMSRALFANKQGPAPLRNKRYPYGFPLVVTARETGQRFNHR